MPTIKILGAGCPNCKKLEAVARKAAAAVGVQAQFIRITGANEMLDYDLLATPGLVIDEQLMSSGRIPTEAEIKGWLTA